MKKSNSWQDSLVFDPSVESSLVTDVGLTGDYDGSRAATGVLGWVAVQESDGGDWRTVTVDDELVAPPAETDPDEVGEFNGTVERTAELTGDVVAFNIRDFRAEWDLRELTEAIEELDENDLLGTEWNELFLELYFRTRSTNPFDTSRRTALGRTTWGYAARSPSPATTTPRTRTPRR